MAWLVTQTWRNGATYVGDYSNGFRTGFGIFAYDKTGIRQEGQWIKGKFQGPEVSELGTPPAEAADEQEQEYDEEDKENSTHCSPLRLVQKSKIPQPVMKTGKLVLPPAPPLTEAPLTLDETAFASV